MSNRPSLFLTLNYPKMGPEGPLISRGNYYRLPLTFLYTPATASFAMHAPLASGAGDRGGVGPATRHRTTPGAK